MRALANNPMHNIEVKEKHKNAVAESNTGMKNKSCDLRLHTFKHVITGVVEICTQHDLKKKYSLKKTGISQLVNRHKNLAYGWILL